MQDNLIIIDNQEIDIDEEPPQFRSIMSKVDRNNTLNEDYSSDENKKKKQIDRK